MAAGYASSVSLITRKEEGIEGGIGVSYLEEVLKSVEKVLEYRYVTVPTGDPAPTPAAGYTVNLVLTSIEGLDLYMEYKVFERTI